MTIAKFCTGCGDPLHSKRASRRSNDRVSRRASSRRRLASDSPSSSRGRWAEDMDTDYEKQEKYPGSHGRYAEDSEDDYEMEAITAPPMARMSDPSRPHLTPMAKTRQVKRIIANLEKIADRVEASGDTFNALQIDKVSSALENSLRNQRSPRRGGR